MTIKRDPDYSMRLEVAGGKAQQRHLAPTAALACPRESLASRNAAAFAPAADGALRTCGDSPGALSPERAAQLRQRTRDGTYNSLAVANEVARRLMASGDLE